MTTPSSEAAPPKGLLYPAESCLVRWLGPHELELFHFPGPDRFRADGRIGREVTELLETGQRGPIIAALPPAHPLGQLLAVLPGQVALPLRPRAALELGGPEILFIELTGGCNQRCLHCYAEAGGEPHAFLPASTAEAVIDEALLLGFRHLQLTGGEPLLHPALLDLVARVAAGGATCEIYTNGQLLDEPLLERLAPLHPSLAYSFYSCDPATHDAITRTPGSQERTREAIVRGLARGLPTRVSIIVMEENAAHVGETRALLRGLGVEAIGIGRAAPVGRSTGYSGELGDAAAGTEAERGARGGGELVDAGPAAGTEEAGGEHGGGELGSAALDPAARGGGESGGRHGRLCVSYDGAVYPCIFNRRDLLGRVPGQRLVEILEHPRLPAPLPPDEQSLAALCTRLPCAVCQLTACGLRALAGAE